MNTYRSAHPIRQPWWKLLRSTLVTLGFMAVGAVVGVLFGTVVDASPLLPEMELSTSEWGVVALLIAPLWLLLVLLHELGHLAGAALSGFKPLLLIVGPLKLTFIGDRVQVALNRSLNLGGGIASALPTREQGIRRGMLLMVLGGPFASLATSLLALGLLQVTTGLPAALAFLACVTSFVLFLVSVLPMQSSGFATDGARIGLLVRGGPQSERWCASALISSAAVAGMLARVEPALVTRATAVRDGSADAVSAAFLAYNYYLSRGELDQAGVELDYTLEEIGAFAAAVRPMVWLEGAYFFARHRGDARTAQAYLEQTQGASLIEQYSRCRAEAAVLHAKGRPAEARTVAEDGLVALRKARIGATGVEEERMLVEML